MKEIIGFLKEIKSDKYEELLSLLELQRDLLEEVSTELGENYISQYYKEKKYEKIDELIEYDKKIGSQIKAIDEILTTSLEDEEDEVEEEENILPKDYSKYEVDRTQRHTLYTNFKNKKPDSFIIEDKRIEVDSWKKMLVETSNYLVSQDENILKDIIENESLKGKKRIYFSSDEKKLYTPRKLNNINAYVETNLSANLIKNIIRKLLNAYNISPKNFGVYLRADFNKKIN